MKEGIDSIQQESFQVACPDGVTLKGMLLLPDKAKAVVQFNGGTATKKEFYLPFLSYLAENGYICCLWDYRGSGESRPESLRDCEYTYRDYGIKDMPAIKAYLTKRFPDKPFLFFGHSAGGQQIGFMDALDDVKGMVNVAVSTGYIPNMPLHYKLQTLYFFHVFTPISILLTGYLKAKKFGIMEDLPRNVVNEWKDWCSKKDYLFDEAFLGKTVPVGNFHQFTFPIHTFWTIDDTISNEKNTTNFWKHIKSSEPITFTKLVPSSLGLKSIGHFGFFKRNMKNLLWPEALTKLDAFLE